MTPARGTFVAIAMLLAWFVWPTPYTLDRREQVNRFTGVRCEIGESCWREEKPPEVPKFDAAKCRRYYHKDWDAVTHAYMDGFHDAAEAAGVCGSALAKSGPEKRKPHPDGAVARLVPSVCPTPALRRPRLCSAVPVVLGWRELSCDEHRNGAAST